MTYDPEQWLVTTVRTLKSYAEAGFDSAVLDNLGNPVGLEAYEVIMEFPGTENEPFKAPFDKTLVHFEIDDINDDELGFGPNIFRDNYDAGTGSVKPQEARKHRINFDVGIWTSDRAGGTTQRMRAYQVLTNLFHGSRARTALWNYSTSGDGGLEILQFTGGRFLTERVDDVPMYRSVDGQLEIRVFSRTPMGVPEPAITEIGQQPGLTIGP